MQQRRRRSLRSRSTIIFPLNSMLGLSLLFLAWSVLANAATLSTRETINVLKTSITSQLIFNPLSLISSSGTQLLTRSDGPTGNAVLKVVTSVKCGKDQTFDNVLVDTGSAILWVGGEEPYVQGSNTEDINQTFGVGYGIGSVQGIAYRDTVTIGDATGHSQFIGAANITRGLDLVKPIDGILGLGPSKSNLKDISGFDTTPTFVETLAAQKLISKTVFGIFIAPLDANGSPEGTGEITFGGIDESKIQGQIVWVQQNDPVNFHWEFNVLSFSFGSVSLTTPTVARTDTGVLIIGLPYDTVFDIKNAYNGSLISDKSAISGTLSFKSSIVPSLPSIDMKLGSEIFSIPPSKYIVPRSLYPILKVKDVPGLERTWIGSAGPGAFGLGQRWLEGVYTAYDMEKHLVGFGHIKDDELLLKNDELLLSNSPCID